MPKATNHHSAQITKALLIGDPGAGKTGAIVSLLLAGYKVFVQDYDNGIDIVVNEVARQRPEALENLVYETLADEPKLARASAKKPVAFETGMRLLDHWKMPERKTPRGIILAEDYGQPKTWGSDTILVLDSLTNMSKAAMNYVQFNMPAKDGRMDYFNAQQKIEDALALLCSEYIPCNVIITSHITYIGEEGAEIGYPTAVGKSLSPRIGSYFNTVLQVKGTGAGNSGKRYIHTQPDGAVSMKNAYPSLMPNRLPLETGMAEIFSILQRGNKRD